MGKSNNDQNRRRLSDKQKQDRLKRKIMAEMDKDADHANRRAAKRVLSSWEGQRIA